jgi:hypothetical protein
LLIPRPRNPTIYRIKKLKKGPRAQKKDYRAILLLLLIIIIFIIIIHSPICLYGVVLNQLSKRTTKAKVKLSLCLSNQVLRHEGVWGSECVNPHILDLGTS